MAHDIVIPDFPSRPADGHKGTFGSVLVVGGTDASESSSLVMIGAPALVARAALRTGCGLVKIAAPDSILQSILTIEPSATGLALPRKKAGQLQASACAAILDEQKPSTNAMAVGPGFGIGFEQQQIIIRLLADEALPIVLDADALSNLAQIPEFASDFRAPAILTPHPGEFARLAEVLNIPFTMQMNKNPAARITATQALAQRLGCIVLLKGAGTVVSDGQRHWTCSIAEPALATAGSGDVLTGIIAALVAQFAASSEAPDLLACAILGVELHARSAVNWSMSQTGAGCGMLASELADQIPMTRTQMSL